jgi:hypothetical protein
LNFVYICRDGENEELRYSIRSVLAHFPKAEIWVVGGKPKWYTGNFIRVRPRGQKYYNARKNLEAIVLSDKIPEDFILMNDDFFIMLPIKNIGYYNGGRLEDKLIRYKKKSASSSYTKMLEATLEGIKSLGIKNPIDYELHVPMPMTKTKLRQVIPYPFLWRSVYGNLFEVGGIEISDVKIYKQEYINPKVDEKKIYQSKFLSTEDRSFNELLTKILKDRFPNPSELEKDPD